MLRTSESDVQQLLLDNFGPRADGSTPSLLRYLQTANAIVNRVVTCAAAKNITLPDDTLELIECWLTAHYYTKADPVYSSKSTAGAGGSFVRDPSNPEPFKAGALDLDYSGCLAAILKGQRAGAAWLGRRPSEQTAYVDRS